MGKTYLGYGCNIRSVLEKLPPFYFTGQMDPPLVAATSPYQKALSFGMRRPEA
jgi:hypothetical protein